MSKDNNDINIRFEKLKEIRLKIIKKIKTIQKIKDEIKKNYVNYINKEQNDFFGLDSFHFQNKVIELEYNNLLQHYYFIDNRIYGDYYKLFILIEKYLNNNITNKQYSKIKELTNLKKYPIYKDLEPYKNYDFDIINNIHQDIITILLSIKDIHKENEITIKEYMKQMKIGLNIDNYIINCEYKNTNLHITTNLYNSYLNVFHKYHFDLLYKYYEKINLFYDHIKNDILIDSDTSSEEFNDDKINYNNFLNDFSNNTINNNNNNNNNNNLDDDELNYYNEETEFNVNEKYNIIELNNSQIVNDISLNLNNPDFINIHQNIKENEFKTVKKNKRKKNKKLNKN